MTFARRGVCVLALLAATGPAARAADDPPPSPEQQVARGNTRFAFDLYGRLRKQDGNLFLSPASVSAALALVQAGTRGETAGELAGVLHLPNDPAALRRGFAPLQRPAKAGPKPPPFQLHTANALWCQKGFALNPEFVRLAQEGFGATAQEVDFAAAPDDARRIINAWVGEKTWHKVKDLLGPNAVDAESQVVLTNAVYFKAGWLREFRKDHTKEAPFHLSSGGKTVPVPLMRRRGSYGYLDGGTFQALELPYAGGDVRMVVFLPRKADGLAKLEAELPAERVASWLAGLKPREVDVELPRFKVTARSELAPVLRSLGVQLAFDPDLADFSGLTSSQEPLAVSAVVHQAFVEVNEEGTEAAAATAVTKPRGLAGGGPEAVGFRADRPFLFLIRDGRTNNLLFLGRLTNPAGRGDSP
jgi:serpin B